MCGQRELLFSKVISPPLSIPATDGRLNLWNNDGLLGMGVIEDQKLEAMGFKNPRVVPTAATKLCVLRMVGMPTFANVLGEFGYPIRFSPEVTQHQAVEFVIHHRDRLHPVPGINTFMLMHARTSAGKLAQGMISIYRGDLQLGALGVGFHEFTNDNRWLDEFQYQLLVPSSVLERRITV